MNITERSDVLQTLFSVLCSPLPVPDQFTFLTPSGANPHESWTVDREGSQGKQRTRQKLLTNDFEPAGSTPEQFGAYIEAETAKWGKVVKTSGAKAG
jgi:hypothetical protein